MDTLKKYGWITSIIFQQITALPIDASGYETGWQGIFLTSLQGVMATDDGYIVKEAWGCDC